jgi:hypothetical protein
MAILNLLKIGVRDREISWLDAFAIAGAIRFADDHGELFVAENRGAKLLKLLRNMAETIGDDESER